MMSSLQFTEKECGHVWCDMFTSTSHTIASAAEAINTTIEITVACTLEAWRSSAGEREGRKEGERGKERRMGRSGG